MHQFPPLANLTSVLFSLVPYLFVLLFLTRSWGCCLLLLLLLGLVLSVCVGVACWVVDVVLCVLVVVVLLGVSVQCCPLVLLFVAVALCVCTCVIGVGGSPCYQCVVVGVVVVVSECCLVLASLTPAQHTP